MARDGRGGDAAKDSMRKTVIFDVDGTLIDSVDFHALAWLEAFK
jgi:FMN phosphatase YigB (HAD superfamily)